MKIAFIGGGVMAEAMIHGLLDKKLVSPDSITASDINPERCKALKQMYRIVTTADNKKALQSAENAVLAVKPQALAEVLAELQGVPDTQQLILSIVAGATISTISRGLKHETIVRAMPNMPAQIGRGISVWTAAAAVNEDQRRSAQSILAALGKEVYVPNEGYLDMATAVSGSGPAYVFLIIEALIDAAVHIGLPRSLAEELVLETMLGSTALAQSWRRHPAELKNMVTSPGGTTAEGLLELEKGGLRAILNQAIKAGYEKARGLGGEDIR
jgi:pyrroline-5-carboxylate reductase